MVESYLKYKTTKLSEEDEDIKVFEEVEVIKDLTAKGPMKGKKYYRVDHHTLSDTLVFRLKSGGCIMVAFGNPPTFLGEKANGPVAV